MDDFQSIICTNHNQKKRKFARGEIVEKNFPPFCDSLIVGRDLLKDSDLQRSMFANGLSTTISGFFGSTPNTTYGENIGVMAITKVYTSFARAYKILEMVSKQ